MMESVVRLRMVSVGVAVSVWLFPTLQGFALGFRNPDQDARATAQGEAFVAQADDPAATYYNPAGLTQLSGTQISAGGYLFFPQIDFHGEAGESTMNSWSMIPHIYLASDLGLEKLRFGFAANVPYGDGVNWGQNGPLRYLVTESQMQVINLAPTLAYQVTESLSFGAGVNVYQGSMEMKRHVDLSGFALPDGRAQFEGDGQAVGATLGLLWKINDQHTLGVTYRSPFSIDFRGHAEMTRIPFPGDYGPASAHSVMEFPQQVAVGYAFRPVPKLKLELDVEWTNWDSLNTVRSHSHNPLFDGDVTASNNVPMNWQDSIFYEFGVQYDLSERWALRSGYIFSENTVPTSTFNPQVVDAVRHIFSAGFGYSAERWTVDLAYQCTLMDDREVNHSVYSGADGQWKNQGHAVMVTTTVKF